jgi:hypothetical protein
LLTETMFERVSSSPSRTLSSLLKIARFDLLRLFR